MTNLTHIIFGAMDNGRSTNPNKNLTFEERIEIGVQTQEIFVAITVNQSVQRQKFHWSHKHFNYTRRKLCGKW